MANAFGLTANQASGLLAWASDHTEQSRPFNPGLAARNGATAALLAEAGMGAPAARPRSGREVQRLPRLVRRSRDRRSCWTASTSGSS